MKRRVNRSHEQLSKSQRRRLSHLMVQCLQKFESAFPDFEDSRDGGRYKNDLKNAFNDAMRAANDELNDYDIEYRPLRMGEDNILALTRTMMETVTKITFAAPYDPFGGFPEMNIHAGADRAKVLDAVRAEFDAGVLFKDDDGLVLCIAGLQDCLKAIPIMDKYRLAPGVRDQYKEWRQEVVAMYRR